MQHTFKSLEQEGWSQRAGSYDRTKASFTNYGIAPLLDAADIDAGQHVLDVCCGTGLVTKAALQRGADVVGLDISEPMVEIAGAKRLDASFRTGDAEALPFPDATFDRVICNFGLYHLHDPDRAITEASRVLKPGGRYAFTTWCGPEVSPLFQIIPGAIKAHGVKDVGLPPAPPPFRLADPDESRKVMAAANFSGIVVGAVPARLEWPHDSIMDLVEQGTVRVTMLLRAQTPEARTRIEAEIKQRTAAFARDGLISMPMPAVVVSGTRS